MFYTELPTPPEHRDFTELKRDDLVVAIEAARAEGYTATEDALLELLVVLDDVLGDGGQIRYRFKPRPGLN